MERKVKLIIIGIDPGFGVKSPTAVSIFDSVDGYIFEAFMQTPGNLKEETEKLSFISKTIAHRLDLKLNEYENSSKRIRICIEDFVMRGKGGQTLARLTGAIIGAMPEYLCKDIKYCRNTTVKMYIGGHGHASKEEVAQGVLGWFSDVPAMKEMVAKWIRNEQWDLTDSLAIGITGLEMPK